MFKSLTILVALMLGLLLTFYLASPWLASRFAADLLRLAGLTEPAFNEVVIDIDHPEWQGITINRIQLASETFTVNGHSARIDYTLAGLLNGQIAAITFESLDIAVFLNPSENPDLAQAQSADTSLTDDIVVKEMFALIPSQYARVDELRLQATDLGFTGLGHAEFSDDGLTFAMRGIAPEPTTHFSVTATLSTDGVLEATLDEQAAGNPDQMILHAVIGTSTLDTKMEFQFQGYAWHLATKLAGLPAGSGAVVGKLEARLPWPLPAALNWLDIPATLTDAHVNWTSASNDLNLELSSTDTQLHGGEVDAQVTGTISSNIDGSDIFLTLPENHRLHYANGRLTSTAGPVLRAQSAQSNLSSTFTSFALHTSPQIKFDFDADIAAIADTVRLQGQLEGQVNSETAPQLSGDIFGHLAFTGDADLDETRRQGTIAADYRVSNDHLKVTGEASTGIFDGVSFDVDYALQSGAGVFSASNTINVRQPIAATLIPDWAEVYDLDEGVVSATVNMSWATLEEIVGQVVLSIDDASAHYESYTASGIATRLKLHSKNLLGEDWTLEPTRLHIAEIDVGVPIENLLLDLSWSGNQLDVAAARAAVLGGQASAGPFAYDIAGGNSAFPLALERINLAAVLALEGEDISGTGLLSGTLPVIISNDEVSIQGGILTALPPGGVIRLSPSLAGVTGQPGLDFALTALQDFTYTELQTEIDYANSGDLKLAVHLQGRNPTVEKNRPIKYNLTITENLPALFASLRLQDKVTEQVEKKVRK